MNKSKIEWCDYTWNPITGCLGPANDGEHCPYCYAKRIAERFRGSKAFPNGFEPTWHPERLSQPAKVKTPSRIFVGSMTDMGAPWVKTEWMDAALDVVRDCPQHTFMFLTKQPKGFGAWPWPENAWLGTTVTKQHEVERIDDLYHFTDDHTAFASFEPLLSFIDTPELARLSWAIIGAQTGPGAIAPKREWIVDLLECLDYYRVPIFMKDNLRPHWDGEWRREFPQ